MKFDANEAKAWLKKNFTDQAIRTYAKKEFPVMHQTIEKLARKRIETYKSQSVPIQEVLDEEFFRGGTCGQIRNYAAMGLAQGKFDINSLDEFKELFFTEFANSIESEVKDSLRVTQGKDKGQSIRRS